MNEINIKSILNEIIQKECELYQLKELGLVSSIEKEVEFLMPLFSHMQKSDLLDKKIFICWRNEVLTHFYKQLKYNDFIKSERENIIFRHFLFILKKRVLTYLKKQYKEPTLDKYLAVPSHTIAFKLSSMLADEQFEKEYDQFLSVSMPSEIELYYRKNCELYYPIDLTTLLSRLKLEDNDFWEEIFLLTKRIAVFVTSSSYLPIQYRDETIQDIWSDCSMLLHERVISGRIPEFESPVHVRNYITRICKLKFLELLKRNKKTTLSLDDPDILNDASWTMIDNEPDNMDLLEVIDDLADIDKNNNYEVSRALTVILWQKTEPWFGKLTNGIEEKVNLFLLFYLEDKSYKEILEMRKENLSEKEEKHLYDKLRQDVRRTRETLKKRFWELLNNQN